MRIRLFLTGMTLLIWLSGSARDPVRTRNDMVDFLKEYLEIKYGPFSFDRLLYVAVKQQKMYLIDGNDVVAEFDISTAKNGIGSEVGSQKTPPGLHVIREKVGGDVPFGGIIREKVYTGEVASVSSHPHKSPGDLITTRLFHLSGMEPGINKEGERDSYQRGIMIHGTPDEGLIGTPVSHGCVRMKNNDIITLYDMVHRGMFVVILNN